ncbi:MAG: hypothetical protein J0M10_03620 [Chitinophagales bacterium]|nr:hypothetical protein [Chitinophagales bacterium]
MKRAITPLLAVLLCTVLIYSCGPDEPPPTLDRQILVTGPTIGPYSVVHCPNPGNNCATPIPCSQGRQAYYDEFTRMVNHDSLDYYFTYGSWTELFPSLLKKQSLLDSLREEQYSIAFDSTGNILIRRPFSSVNDLESYENATRFAVVLEPCN